MACNEEKHAERHMHKSIRKHRYDFAIIYARKNFSKKKTAESEFPNWNNIHLFVCDDVTPDHLFRILY